MLAVGSLGVVLWRMPVLAAGAVASFLLGVTPTMHDFWNEADDQRRQVELSSSSRTSSSSAPSSTSSGRA